MMKKLVIMWIAICITILLGVNLVNGFTGELSNEEIMEQYIADEYNEGCYGMITYCDEECIKFMIYDEYGIERCVASVTKEYYPK